VCYTLLSFSSFSCFFVTFRCSNVPILFFQIYVISKCSKCSWANRPIVNVTDRVRVRLR
jgi:hypothetical protein